MLAASAPARWTRHKTAAGPGSRQQLQRWPTHTSWNARYQWNTYDIRFKADVAKSERLFPALLAVVLHMWSAGEH